MASHGGGRRDRSRRERARRPHPARSGSRRPARRPPRDRQGSDVAARILTAVPALIFAIVIVAYGGLVFTVGLFLIGAVCLHELYGMLREAYPVRLAGFLGLAGLLLAATYGDQFQILLVAMALIPVLFFLVMHGPARTAPALAMSTTLFGLWWIGFALAHAVLLRDLPHGDGIVVDVLVGTFLTDTGAYFGGRLFGSRPLAPRISPNKTLEGLLIGIVVGIAAVWFAGLYQDWLSGTDALILGVAVAVAAPVGDLFESAIKRGVGAKDTGTLFGAHGGALDRLDAVLFTAVVGYYVWVWLM